MGDEKARRPDAQTSLPEHPDITDYRTVAEVLAEAAKREEGGS